MSTPTDTRIFEAELVCTKCGKPLGSGDVSTERECPMTWDHADFQPRSYRSLLPGADRVKNIHLMRHEAGALVDIEQRFVVHSPTGFEWGYGGSGPADLALNVLALFVAPPEAWRLHQAYKWDVIARLNRDGPHTIAAASVRDWLQSRWAAEQAESAA